jgi:hypothetical protein
MKQTDMKMLVNETKEVAFQGERLCCVVLCCVVLCRTRN